jgi:hypothetical protein
VAQLYGQNLVCILDLVLQHFCEPVGVHAIAAASVQQERIHHNVCVGSLELEVMVIWVVHQTKVQMVWWQS